MPRLIPKKRFLRKAYKIAKGSNSSKEKLLRTLKILQENPFTPSLDTHKLSGNLKDTYACSVTDDIRITFMLSGDTIHLLNIGSHDEVY
ncbi:MAG: type II toxin-antitoxin system mRNA interferase toxin, RelE/StbE family [Nitrospirae bacterium]|nr:type II toxin-antitoxin system mRNA interferase toxin, RelE/StbE family [Nitrospirota bacterium]